MPANCTTTNDELSRVGGALFVNKDVGQRNNHINCNLRPFIRYLGKKRRKRKKRSCWIHPWLARRKERGFYYQLFQEISVEDTPAFFELMRMTKSNFDFLVEILYPKLAKKDTIMRNSIKPAEMCCLALWFLATGESFRSLHLVVKRFRKSLKMFAKQNTK